MNESKNIQKQASKRLSQISSRNHLTSYNIFLPLAVTRHLQYINFFLKTVASDRLFGTKTVWRERIKVQVSDPGRTIIDLLDDPRLGGGIRPCYDIIVNYLNSDNKDLNLLLKYAERLGNGAVFKRMGYLIEGVLPEEKEFLAECLARIKKCKSTLDPALSAERLVTKWQLWVPNSWKEGK